MKPQVLLVERSAAARSRFRNALCSRYVILEASLEGLAPRIVREQRIDAVIVGSVGSPAEGTADDALDLVAEIRDASPRVPIILSTSDASADVAIAALRLGVNDYLRQPVEDEAMLAAVDRVVSQDGDGHLGAARRTAAPASGLARSLIGDSAGLRGLRDYLLKVAQSECNVLVTGETGTGKEVVVRLLHNVSSRAGRPFLCLNCAAVPDMLLESELFGYERGAFTGATAAKEGKAQLADGGTLFLDEIGEMSLSAQAKILRMIENREIQRLGGRAPLPVDVRIVAATNEELEEKVRERTFRADLYFRLNVARIHVPPLRERKEDLEPLVRHFVAELNRRCGLDVRGCTVKALELMSRHDWPGNVRELRNVLEAAFINRPATIDVEHLPPTLMSAGESHSSGNGNGNGNGDGHGSSGERERILGALARANGNKSVAAKALHCSRMTLYRKIERYGL